MNTEPLTVDSIQIYVGQRYSFILTADQAVDNCWIRTVANGGTVMCGSVGINSAILRYVGADEVGPVTSVTDSTAPLVETDLRPLVPTAVPGTPVAGGADGTMNLAITIDFMMFAFSINGAPFAPSTVPVLQILSGAQTATDPLPTGSVFTLPANSVVELSIPGGSACAPLPFHLHGHNFFVIKSAGNDTFNFDNPRILHCHIDFHLELGLTIVFAEQVDAIANSTHPTAWDDLCPTYDALPSDEV
ncbi:Cupredoxin [Mycena rosella]|uniref:laccase n=1 Tax=Mycena rosella TaxID=1033263 RepID=A0AAD7GDH4_MYCRO|nr:Cupredoxin [Mycena rosella]